MQADLALGGLQKYLLILMSYKIFYPYRLYLGIFCASESIHSYVAIKASVQESVMFIYLCQARYLPMIRCLRPKQSKIR